MAVLITAHTVMIIFDSIEESCRLVRPTIDICLQDNYTHLSIILNEILQLSSYPQTKIISRQNDTHRWSYFRFCILGKVFHRQKSNVKEWCSKVVLEIISKSVLRTYTKN